MKQPRKSYDCMIAVAAMAAGCSFRKAKRDMGPSKDGYWDSKLLDFLENFGEIFGIPYGNVTPAIKQLPAVVCVASETLTEDYHILYWDGKKVWDPNPDVEDGRPLDDYMVYYWTPIFKI